ncbi:hypothetical protein ABZ801_33340 [Actinomadura sp. NPDC047616]|uniref:hypothetical protein n=1 Tax=Actinomadura sp. NPDC047616 TaxID=3155914 RepID=UPI0033F628CF
MNAAVGLVQNLRKDIVHGRAACLRSERTLCLGSSGDAHLDVAAGPGGEIDRGEDDQFAGRVVAAPFVTSM